MNNMTVTKQTREEYAGERLPNLYKRMTENGITHVITIQSEKALSQACLFKNGVTQLWYGSRSLLDRYLATRIGE